MKKPNYILCILGIIFCFLLLFQFFPSHSVKYASDYSSTDMLKIQKYFLNEYELSDEEFLKYDMNEDGTIDYTDIQIIQNMLIHIYDEYEVRNKKAVKIRK